MWKLPLYLYTSSVYNDTVLLNQNPLKFSDKYSDYTLLYEDPVAFVHRVEENPIYPLISLNLYWSQQRSDLQTSAWTIEELNSHGGDYIFVETIGLIASSLSPGIKSHLYTPLSTSYDEARQDAITAPLSYADVNLLLEDQLDNARFRDGHMVGYAMRADCSMCNISMSETFPSAGGADCAFECPLNAPFCTGSKYELGNIHSAESDAFDEKMKAAGEILTSFGDATVTYGSKLHMSMNYFCCYSDVDLDVIRNVLNEFNWPPVNITFDRAVWRIDSDAMEVNHYSIIVLIDEESQAKMHTLVAEVESKLRSAGIDVHVPRLMQEPFHATLGVVNGLSYPVVAALNAVTDAFPPGSWTSDGAITVEMPTWG